MNPRFLIGQRFKTLGPKVPNGYHPEIRLGANREALLEGEWHLRPISGPIYLYPVEDVGGQYAQCRSCSSKSPVTTAAPFPEPAVRTVTWAEEHRCPRESQPLR